MTSPASIPTKHRRQRLILDLVRRSHIQTQEQLVSALRGRRVAVTQATVSRDIRELGLVRVPDGAGARYLPPAAEIDVTAAQRRLQSALREHLVTLEFIDLLGVLHTLPGCASVVATAIDGARFDELAGTLAGDDTVLMIARSRPAAQRLSARLRAMADERP